jgi:hypothetical protein
MISRRMGDRSPTKRRQGKRRTVAFLPAVEPEMTARTKLLGIRPALKCLGKSLAPKHGRGRQTR